MSPSQYLVLARECQTGTCDHEPGRCLRYRSRRCLSGECGHAREGLVCAIDYDAYAPITAPAPAPAVVDVTQSYAYQVQRTDGPEDARTLMYGTQTIPLSCLTSPALVADYECAQARIAHRYYGPARVSVWQHRGDQEHYGAPIPDGAFVADYGPCEAAEPLKGLMATLAPHRSDGA